MGDFVRKVTRAVRGKSQTSTTMPPRAWSDPTCIPKRTSVSGRDMPQLLRVQIIKYCLERPGIPIALTPTARTPVPQAQVRLSIQTIVSRRLSFEDHSLLIDTCPRVQAHLPRPTHNHQHKIQRIPKRSHPDASISRGREHRAVVAGRGCVDPHRHPRPGKHAGENRATKLIVP